MYKPILIEEEFCINHRGNALEFMTNNNVYLPSSSSTKSCDTSYSSSKEEMEVVSMIQPYEWEPQASNEDFNED